MHSRLPLLAVDGPQHHRSRRTGRRGLLAAASAAAGRSELWCPACWQICSLQVSLLQQAARVSREPRRARCSACIMPIPPTSSRSSLARSRYTCGAVMRLHASFYACPGGGGRVQGVKSPNRKLADVVPSPSARARRRQPPERLRKATYRPPTVKVTVGERARKSATRFCIAIRSANPTAAVVNGGLDTNHREVGVGDGTSRRVRRRLPPARRGRPANDSHRVAELWRSWSSRPFVTENGGSPSLVVNRDVIGPRLVSSNSRGAVRTGTRYARS